MYASNELSLDYRIIQLAIINDFYEIRSANIAQIVTEPLNYIN